MNERFPEDPFPSDTPGCNCIYENWPELQVALNEKKPGVDPQWLLELSEYNEAKGSGSLTHEEWKRTGQRKCNALALEN